MGKGRVWKLLIVVGSEYDLRRPVERGLAMFSRTLAPCWSLGRDGPECINGIGLFELFSFDECSVAGGFGADAVGFTPSSMLLLSEWLLDKESSEWT